MIQIDFLSNIEIEDKQEKEKNSKINDSNFRKKIKQKYAITGGYRPVLVDETSLKNEAIELESRFQLLNNHNDLNDQDMVSFYILTYLNQRYPNNLFQNKNAIIADSSKIKSNDYLNLISFKNKNIQSRLSKLENVKTLFDLINNFNLNSVPYSARFTLVNWYLSSSIDESNKFKLILFVNKIPTSLDVLKMQSKGQRCVSMIYDKIDSLIMNERDPLSFLLHDLVHAFKMFSNDYLLKGQIGFYRAILKIFNDSNGCLLLNELIENDKKFADEFDYLISDMNSHPKHLFYYFKAILIYAYKRKYGLDEKADVLCGESLIKFNESFELFLNLFEMNSNEKESCRQMLNVNDSYSHFTNNINDKSVERFNLIDFTLLDNFFIKLYDN